MSGDWRRKKTEKNVTGIKRKYMALMWEEKDAGHITGQMLLVRRNAFKNKKIKNQAIVTWH